MERNGKKLSLRYEVKKDGCCLGVGIVPLTSLLLPFNFSLTSVLFTIYDIFTIYFIYDLTIYYLLFIYDLVYLRFTLFTI